MSDKEIKRGLYPTIHMSKYPKVSHSKVYVSYLIFVLVYAWIGHHNNGLIQASISLLSHGIPSISSLSSIANNPTKAEFELAASWLFSVVIPFFSFKN